MAIFTHFVAFFFPQKQETSEPGGNYLALGIITDESRFMWTWPDLTVWKSEKVKGRLFHNSPNQLEHCSHLLVTQ